MSNILFVQWVFIIHGSLAVWISGSPPPIADMAEAPSVETEKAEPKVEPKAPRKKQAGEIGLSMM